MPEKKPIKVSIPKTMGACADKLYKTQQARYDAQKIVDALAKQESVLKEHIINTLPKSKASGIAGKIARVSVVLKPTPQVEDWDKFYKYVKRTDSFDLLQRRLSTAAVRERWEDNKKVNGVGSFNRVTVSINKL